VSCYTTFMNMRREI